MRAYILKRGLKGELRVVWIYVVLALIARYGMNGGVSGLECYSRDKARKIRARQIW